MASVPANCANCGQLLTGEWCGQCGQRCARRLELGAFVRDSLGNLSELVFVNLFAVLVANLFVMLRPS